MWMCRIPEPNEYFIVEPHTLKKTKVLSLIRTGPLCRLRWGERHKAHVFVGGCPNHRAVLPSILPTDDDGRVQGAPYLRKAEVVPRRALRLPLGLVRERLVLVH